MLAVAGPLPPPEVEDRYGYEMKWDGVRAVVAVEADGRVRVLTRNDRDVAATYPELAGLADAVPRPCLLDGEIVTFDQGRPSFARLQRRMHVSRPAEARALREAVPVIYLAFDLLHLGTERLLSAPYVARRQALERLALDGPAWASPPWFAGDGAAVLAASQARGLEGVVAKRLDSVYEPGRRTGAWIKVKNVRTQEVVIGGWKPGAGRRQGGIGSLLLGVPGPGGLRYAGHVGTGFTAADLTTLEARLRPLVTRDSPFAEPVPREHARDAVWVRPDLVGEVVFTEWTPDLRLRHPSWRGLRPDKDPDDVVLA